MAEVSPGPEGSDTGSEPTHLERPRPRPLVRWGVIGTLIYVLALVVYVLVCHRAVFAMEPAEFGTFLGGIVSPLAFLWLVLGFFQQGDELRYSADALWLQGQELRHSVEQQRQLVAVNREQVDAEIAARKVAEQEAERLSKPNFVLTSMGWINSGGTRTFKFRITNSGALCSKVHLAYGEGSRSLAIMGTGDSIDFEFVFEPGEEIASQAATLTSTDARGRTGSHIFGFGPRESGGRTILHGG